MKKDGNLAMKDNLPVIYKFNKKAWMDSSIWTNWLIQWDNKLQLSNPPRKILLIVDNCSAHSILQDICFSNIVLDFLPANTTSRLQPLDAGIIKTLKTKYRTSLVEKQLENIENSIECEEFEKVTLLEAIEMISQAWNEVSVETIMNCWAHTGIFSPEQEVILRNIDSNSDSDSNSNRLAELLGRVSFNKQEEMLTVEDYIHIDSLQPTDESEELLLDTDHLITNVRTVE
jgi:hypothetical protein